MNVTQFEKANPIYNRLHDLSRDLKLLATFKSALTDESKVTIQLSIKGVSTVKVEALEHRYAVNLIDSIVKYRMIQVEVLQEKLEAI